jgi:TRAP-type mannitol/chloroaromatic compound transport system substrate-binding protein
MKSILSRKLHHNHLNFSVKHFTTSEVNNNPTKWPLNWELQSVWPQSLINNECVEKFKESIEHLSDKKWTITPKYGVNKDLAFENIKHNKTQMIVGHSTYWNGMSPAASFFASIPFGMSRSEFLCWVQFGGGRKYWEDLHAPNNIFPLLAGDTGMQMGGWFPKRINTLEDFKGLKMRIEGLGGPVLERYGVKLVNAPASKLLSMLESGELDACEFATPVMDEAAGLHKTKKKFYFHYPGWHQPSAVFEFLINKDLYSTLSNQQIHMLNAASLHASMHFTLHLQAENELVIEKMVKGGVELHQFPEELLVELKKISTDVLKETMSQDKFSNEVMESYLKFLDRMSLWGPMSGKALWKWRKENIK